jgi:hypothetical protein
MSNTFTAEQTAGVFPVEGSMRCVDGVLTMTDGPGVVALGLEFISGGSVTPKTCVTGGYGAVLNSTSKGSVKINSCASGDTFNVSVRGF